MFNRILIANRGEIALRIINACKEMCIQTVAVFSEADRESAHVAFADESICIGPPTVLKSYHDIFTILDAAVISNSDAIHPGYGFLSESPQFAEICEKCNIVFIGPGSSILSLALDKYKLRKKIKNVGIPVIPGSDDEVTDLKTAVEIAEGIGYPVIVRASSGWWTRGVNLVYDEKELKETFNSLYAANDSHRRKSIYIEKYIERARHIEFQILSDNEGNTIHLGERDCTVRRPYQKMIEETPSQYINNILRKKIGEVAVKVAETIGYFNTGTVKFIIDKDKNYYFKELNPRIQVEHPITEMVTGIDIIQEQIKIAAGEKLRYKQDDININGHAIECRIYAEDPENNFFPSTGIIDNLFIPGGNGIRVDTHIYKGYYIPQYYDSLLGKLIVFAEKRAEAVKKALCSLEEFEISGIKTTNELIKKILSHSEFIEGNYSTELVNKVLNGG